jgi:hypothetical protein
MEKKFKWMAPRPSLITNPTINLDLKVRQCQQQQCDLQRYGNERLLVNKPLGYGGYEKLRLPKVPVEPQLQASTPSHLHAQ